jgi:hypothetical protein
VFVLGKLAKNESFSIRFNLEAGHSGSGPLKGYRGEDAKDKKATMETRWIPGVNRLESHGRRAFAEFTDVWEMESDLENKISEQLETILSTRITEVPGE